jgi:hypothetical protein
VRRTVNSGLCVDKDEPANFSWKEILVIVDPIRTCRVAKHAGTRQRRRRLPSWFLARSRSTHLFLRIREDKKEGQFSLAMQCKPAVTCGEMDIVGTRWPLVGLGRVGQFEWALNTY